MNRQSRTRRQKREESKLPERQVSAHTYATGKIIAEATGTIWAPVAPMTRRRGGGVIWDFVRKTKTIHDTGAYGR